VASVQGFEELESQDQESPRVDVDSLDTEDLEALALHVYELLKRELLLEHDRQGNRRIW
jgi:hypothetical protein